MIVLNGDDKVPKTNTAKLQPKLMVQQLTATTIDQTINIFCLAFVGAIKSGYRFNGSNRAAIWKALFDIRSEIDHPNQSKGFWSFHRYFICYWHKRIVVAFDGLRQISHKYIVRWAVIWQARTTKKGCTEPNNYIIYLRGTWCPFDWYLKLKDRHWRWRDDTIVYTTVPMILLPCPFREFQVPLCTYVACTCRIG